MTTAGMIAAGAGAVAATAAIAVGSTVALTGGTSAVTTSTVPAPANVEALHVDSTSITVGWGPTLPGVLTPGAATARSLVIKWGPSQDNHGPVTYTMSKNGKVIVTGMTVLAHKVGFTAAVRTFRACVWGVSTQGKSGPPMCATFKGA